MICFGLIQLFFFLSSGDVEYDVSTLILLVLAQTSDYILDRVVSYKRFSIILVDFPVPVLGDWGRVLSIMVCNMCSASLQVSNKSGLYLGVRTCETHG